jgi:hypothetical protein
MVAVVIVFRVPSPRGRDRSESGWLRVASCTSRLAGGKQYSSFLLAGVYVYVYVYVCVCVCVCMFVA